MSTIEHHRMTRSAVPTPLDDNDSDLRRVIATIAAGAAERERMDGSASEAIDLLKNIRYGAIRLPKNLNGGGASLRQLIAYTIDLAEADPNVPHILRNHFFLVEKVLRSDKFHKIRDLGPAIAAGKIFGAGATELSTQNIGGGNIGGGKVNTRLVQAGDVYLLNGVKVYSTGNLYADDLVIHANLETGDDAFALVSSRQEGVTIKNDWDGIGQRATASGTTVFENVRVARENIILLHENGPQLPFESTFLQLYLTAIIAGILRSVVSDAAEVIRGRDRNFYHAVTPNPAEDPLLQQVVGRLASVAFIAEAGVLSAAEALELAFQSAIDERIDETLFTDASLKAATAKIMIDEMALSAATQLFDVGGASAVRQPRLLDRHWRNIRTIASHNPVSYKSRAVGDFVINQTPLPNAAYF